MAQRPVKIDALITVSDNIPVSVVHSLVLEALHEAVAQIDNQGLLQSTSCSERKPKPVEEEWVMETQTYHVGDGSYMGSR